MGHNAIRDAFKKENNRNMGHCPKGCEGVPTGSPLSVGWSVCQKNCLSFLEGNLDGIEDTKGDSLAE